MHTYTHLNSIQAFNHQTTMKSIQILFLITSLLPLISSAQPFDYPTATPGTKWTNSPALNHTINYPSGATIRALLLKGNLGPSFACGFFCTSPCTSFYLSIYVVYTNSGSGITGLNNASPQVVWSANRDRPVKENATLDFSGDGDLVLRDSDGSHVWSTNTSAKSVASMAVNGIGELALLDKSGAKVWSSVDYPTDSWVLGQTLKQGARLTANVSSTNPSRGVVYLSIVDGGFRAFVGSNPPQMYYENVVTSSEVGMNSTRVTFRNGSLDVFVGSSSTAQASVALPMASSVQYMRLDYGGHLRIYEWSSEFRWKLLGDVINIFPDDCAYPTACGVYGICSSGQCTCPSVGGGKPYFRPIVERQPNFGCALLRGVSCKSKQLLSLKNVGYFGYSDSTAADAQGISKEGCRRLCLKKCECKAAFFQYGGNALDGSCYLVSEVFTLIDNKPEITHFNSSAYIKV